MDNNQPNQPGTLAGLVQTGTVFDKKQTVDTFKALIKEGNVDPLAPYTVLKRMQKVAEEVFEDKEVQKIINDEADKHLVAGKKSFNLYSAQICKTAVYTYYDCKNCGHPVLDQLYKIQETVEGAIKQIEAELKLLIPDEKKGFGIQNDTKQIVVEQIPFLKWEPTDDIAIVRAPEKIQKIGLKYMKI